MSTMSDRRSIAANTRSGNILAGKPFEFVARAAIINVYIVAAAVGINADVQVGGESIVQDEEVSGANRFPQTDTDLFTRHGGLPGERIFISLRNTTGAAVIVNTLVEVLPL